MKGTLVKTDKGWVVEYAKHSELPLHPDYVKCYFLDEDADGAEVEFEVITYNQKGSAYNNLPNNTYAKLIKPLDLSKMEQKLDDALANETSESLEEWILNKREIHNYKLGLDDGYNLAKKTLYTEEQVRKAYFKGAADVHDKCTDRTWRGVETKVDIELLKKLNAEYIQSIKQPKQ